MDVREEFKKRFPDANPMQARDLLTEEVIYWVNETDADIASSGRALEFDWTRNSSSHDSGWVILYWEEPGIPQIIAQYRE